MVLSGSLDWSGFEDLRYNCFAARANAHKGRELGAMRRSDMRLISGRIHNVSVESNSIFILGVPDAEPTLNPRFGES